MQELKDRFRGHNTHRLSRESLEEKFAKTWKKFNTQNNIDLMQWIFCKYYEEAVQMPAYDLTDRDYYVAATIIQWLGSSVGQSFLDEVMK